MLRGSKNDFPQILHAGVLFSSFVWLLAPPGGAHTHLTLMDDRPYAEQLQRDSPCTAVINALAWQLNHLRVRPKIQIYLLHMFINMRQYFLDAVGQQAPKKQHKKNFAKRKKKNTSKNSYFRHAEDEIPLLILFKQQFYYYNSIFKLFDNVIL